MKKILLNKGFVLTMVSVLIISANATAQGPNHKMCSARENIPNLTDEQAAKIDALRTAHMQEITTFKAELQVLEAELQQLEIAANADVTKINAKIDEISAVKNKMAKEHSKLRQSIRSILTAEQRTFFDANCCHGTNHCGNMKHSGNYGKEHHGPHGQGQGCAGK